MIFWFCRSSLSSRRVTALGLKNKKDGLRDNKNPCIPLYSRPIEGDHIGLALNKSTPPGARHEYISCRKETGSGMCSKT